MKAWYAALSKREQRFVQIGAIAVPLILVLMLWLPWQRSVSELSTRVETKRGDLEWMRGVAPTLAAAGPVAETPADHESLVVIADRAAREANLGESLVRSDAAGDGSQRMQLENASFDVMVAWLARLREQHGIRVTSATVERTGEPGRVNATVVLSTR